MKSDTGLMSFRYFFVALAVVWILQAAFVGLLDPYIYKIVILAGVNIILAVSLNLVNGNTGLFSMGHAGFMAVGAYSSALITKYLIANYSVFAVGHMAIEVAFVVSLFIGGLVSAGVGYLVGLPSLRLKGDYLAIVTLGFGEIIRVVLLNSPIVGGAMGMPGIANLASFGWVYTFVVFTVFFIWRLINGSYGRNFLSVREDEVAAEAMGVAITSAKVKSFMIGAFFAGIAGGLFAHDLQFLSPSIFDFNKSFEIIIMVVLGGMGSISGAIVAAVFLTFMKEILRLLQEITHVDLRMVIYSLMLIVLMLTRPNGIFGTLEITDVWRRFRKGAQS
jgi:branched-chain amino acid transport system permease protein